MLLPCFSLDVQNDAFRKIDVVSEEASRSQPSHQEVKDANLLRGVYSRVKFHHKSPLYHTLGAPTWTLLHLSTSLPLRDLSIKCTDLGCLTLVNRQCVYATEWVHLIRSLFVWVVHEYTKLHYQIIVLLLIYSFFVLQGFVHLSN